MILNAVDRASAVGKRDYAILLCIAVYGWRAGDIRNIRLEDIDWKNNKISFIQQKTKVPAEYPILPVVGNAIADYLKCTSKIKFRQDFLKMSYKFSGQIITGPAFIQAILLKYIQRVGIKDLKAGNTVLMR